jgi:hypothetical protein
VEIHLLFSDAFMAWHRDKFTFTVVKTFVEKVVFIQMVTNSMPL